MVDNLNKRVRSRVMASIRNADTVPELIVRKRLWSLGKRYRKNDSSVPGTPDVSNKRNKIAVFIDGCFWHGCSKCYKEPTSNVSFWRRKLQYNKKRREIVRMLLKGNGWTVLEYWEHEVLAQPRVVTREIARMMK